jgi:hypothetical protein
VTSLLTRLTELEQAATPGPWEQTYQTGHVAAADPKDEGYWIDVANTETLADAALIAASRNALPSLLEVVRTLEAKARYWNENAHVLTHGADGVMRACAASVVAALAPLLGEGDS